MSLKRLWIDAGHGGKDSGAVGPTGLKESAVVLSVALLLQAELTGEVEIGATRITDTYVSLPDRVQRANEWKADLFLSIHCNSAETQAMGIETFIARKTKVSFPAGEAVQDALTQTFPTHTDRGLKRRDFYVLRHTNMAAVLAELEFIHVACGEAHLADRKVQASCARALASAVREFFKLEGPRPQPVLDDPEEPRACPALQVADQLDGPIRQLQTLQSALRS